MSTALIFGIASQDGSYLAEFLQAKKYQVVGTVRSHGDDLANISSLSGLVTEKADLLQPDSLEKLIQKYQPEEVYNLAAMTVPGESWDKAALVGQVTGIAPVYIMEAIRKHSPKARFFQATSREIFGEIELDSANENTPVHPENPYAAAKAYAHHMVKIYRGNNIFACSGILFNHESPRRPLSFVTRKITSAVAAIKKGTRDKLSLGDLSSSRDRGFAGDYVEAMWLMLQHDTPKDYIIATNSLHSVRDICEIAFSSVDLKWEDYVISDPKLIRARDTRGLKGDYSLIQKELDWQPKTDFDSIIKSMVVSDLQTLSVTPS
jgi:GDPmannose 4,6-dehydratase